MNRLTAALRDYPHTRPLMDGTMVPEGCELDLIDVEPIHWAFALMVRGQRYDVCELAIATLFQAVEAGCPVAALPVVLYGNQQQGSHLDLGGDRAPRSREPARPAGRRPRLQPVHRPVGPRHPERHLRHRGPRRHVGYNTN